jgi:hypothetical protein
MKALEESVRSISQDGLVWGSSTLVPVGTNALKRVGVNCRFRHQETSDHSCC